MKKYFTITIFISICLSIQAQVHINRYDTRKVSSKGIFGKSEVTPEVLLPVMDVNKMQKHNNKFGEPVLVNIDPLQQGYWEIINGYTVNRIKITAKNAGAILLYFDKLKLSQNAELFIYNEEGTIITGPITQKENIVDSSLWGSNAFPGQTVILELKVPVNEKELNELHISKIISGFKVNLNQQTKDSLIGPGFGVSSPCNVNVICASSWQLESKAVAIITNDNASWASCALIMNTCGTNRPYILTANHVVFQNGSLINTNNSTFEFLWISPTCNTTTNTTSILFNGATIRARWDHTDFALLELNQTIPSNSGLSFLGWSRSSTIPNSTAGIHHPRGDMMKISFDSDPAVIGSIGTFTNTAWRVQWDLGVVEDGSSGSPLFDPNHKVIGQLYSNTQDPNPPCNPQSGGTNAGRFDISWEGGGTPATRLRDWLDPSSSNAMTTNTTNIAQLVPFPLTISITGADLFCSGTQTYNLNGAPQGHTIIWSVQPQGYATITPNGTSCDVTMISPGAINLSASVDYTNCNSNTITKVIHMGGYGSGDYPVSGPSSAGCGAYVTYTTNQLPGATNYSWFYPSSWTYVDGQGTYMLTLMTPSNSSASNYGQIGVRVANTCDAGGSYAMMSTFVSGCYGYYGYYSYSVYPNPATSNITVAPATSASSNTIRQTSITEIKIYDQQGNLKKHQSFNKVSKATIDVSNLPLGIYIVEITNGSYNEKQKLTIAK